MSVGETSLPTRPDSMNVLATVHTEAVASDEEPTKRSGGEIRLVAQVDTEDETPLQLRFDQYAAAFVGLARRFSPPPTGTTVPVSNRLISRALTQALSFLDVDFTYAVKDYEFGFHEEVAADGAKLEKDCSGLRKQCVPHGCNEDCRGRSCDRECRGRECGGCNGYSCDRSCGRYS